MDPDYMSSLLAGLPGVDMNDPAIIVRAAHTRWCGDGGATSAAAAQEAMAMLTKGAGDKKDKKKEGDDKK